MKPNWMTKADHERAGQFLATTHDALTHLQVLIGNTYPISGREYRKAAAAVRALDALRSALDNRLFREHEGERLADVYYGPRRAWVELVQGHDGVEVGTVVTSGHAPTRVR